LLGEHVPGREPQGDDRFLDHPVSLLGERVGAGRVLGTIASRPRATRLVAHARTCAGRCWVQSALQTDGRPRDICLVYYEPGSRRATIMPTPQHPFAFDPPTFRKPRAQQAGDRRRWHRFVPARAVNKKTILSRSPHWFEMEVSSAGSPRKPLI